nr:Chain B, pCPC5 [synthetic construct]
SPAPRPLDL